MPIWNRNKMVITFVIWLVTAASLTEDTESNPNYGLKIIHLNARSKYISVIETKCNKYHILHVLKRPYYTSAETDYRLD